jgi:hypothetical protein
MTIESRIWPVKIAIYEKNFNTGWHDARSL